MKIPVLEGATMPVIRFRGEFDWFGLYRLVRDWLQGNRYDYEERRFKQKPDEIEVDMVGEREIDALHKNHIYVYIQVLNYEERTVNGKRMLKGRLEMRFQATLEVDQNNRFKGKMGTVLGKWWFTIKKRDILFKYADPLIYDVYGLHTDVKEHLGLTAKSNAF